MNLDEYRELVNLELKKYFESFDLRNPILKKHYNLIKDFCLADSKRLRPILLIESYKAVGGKEIDKILKASLCVELLHNSSLVQDDVMDEDKLRRNNKTFHESIREWFLSKNADIEYEGLLYNKLSSRISTSSAIMVGNILYSMGLDCLSGLKNIEAVNIYIEAIQKINQGQIIDMSSSEFKEKDYFEMIKLKTAALFIASAKIGAALGNASDSQIKTLEAYAENIGIAFQLYDDLIDLDYTKQKGHEFGSDIKEGKKTLIVIKALEQANNDQKNKIMDVLGKKHATDEEIKAISGLFNGLGVIKDIRNLAEMKIKIAKDIISNALLKEESKKFLNSLADYLVNRSS